MSLYIDYDYMVLYMGDAPLSSSLSYNGTAASQTGSVFAQFASGACSKVDSYLLPTYEVPVSPVPEMIKSFAAAFLKRDLLARQGMEIPTQLHEEIKSNQGYLFEIHQGNLQLPSVTKNTDGNTSGGAVFSDTSEGADLEAVMSRDKLKGTYL